MKRILSAYILCFSLFHCYEIDAIQVGLIRNMSFTIANTNSTIINGTCQECLCRMAFDAQFSSFNCHTNNQTCQMHSKTNQSQTVNAIVSSSTHFYFFSLPLPPLNSTPLQSLFIERAKRRCSIDLIFRLDKFIPPLSLDVRFQLH